MSENDRDREGREGKGKKGELMWRVIELSLTVPITNSLAFLFTVLGEWWAEGKVISRGERDFTFIWSFFFWNLGRGD